MPIATFFQDASLGGTGATELANSSADSATLVDAGDTLSFNGATTDIDMAFDVVVDDAGTDQLIQAPSTVNGVSVGVGTDVEYNYTLVLDDPATGLWYRVDVFAYGGDDGNKTYFVSDGWDPVAQAFTDTDYAGQELVVLDAGDITGGNNTAGVSIALNDPELNDFARGDGTLTLTPENDDAEAGTLSDLAICFVKGAMIMTQRGLAPVETLTVADHVETVDHGLQPIKWIGIRNYDAAEIAASPGLAPVRIKAGALGPHMPDRDLMVSQQHRVLVASKIAERMFGAREVLVAAKHLAALDGVEIVYDADGVTYAHFLCEGHELVIANGCVAETLYPGRQALRSIPPAAVAEILAIFPELKGRKMTSFAPVRPLATGRRSRNLARRLAKNGKEAAEKEVAAL